MKTFGLRLGLLSILSAEAFADGYLIDKAAKYSCSNNHLFIQVPYRYDSGATSLWFKVRVNADGSIDSTNHSAEFTEEDWKEREDKKWESIVKFRGETDLDAAVVCRELGGGCTLTFSPVDKAASTAWDNVTCKEARYVPKFENVEMEIGGSGEYEGFKFPGKLWDFEGFFNLEFDYYTIEETPESWSGVSFRVSDLRRYGSSLGFTMDLYHEFGYCDKDEKGEICSSGEGVWPDVNVLVTKNSAGFYEGNYFHGNNSSSFDPEAKILIRPR